MTLITSRVAKGACPVCGAANCSCKGTGDGAGGSGVVIRPAQKGGGPLVHIPLRDGLSIQVTEQTARELGYLEAEPEPEQKMQTPVKNKMRRKSANKALD